MNFIKLVTQIWTSASNPQKGILAGSVGLIGAAIVAGTIAATPGIPCLQGQSCTLQNLNVTGSMSGSGSGGGCPADGGSINFSCQVVTKGTLPLNASFSAAESQLQSLEQTTVATPNFGISSGLFVTHEANPAGNSQMLYSGGFVQSDTIMSTGVSYTDELVGLVAEAEHNGFGPMTQMEGLEGDAVVESDGGATALAEGVVGSVANLSSATMTDGRGVYGVCTSSFHSAPITTCRGAVGQVQTFSGPITTAYGVQAKNATVSGGTITGLAGLVCDEMTGATNNTDLLIGSGSDPTPPTGNFALYSLSTRPSVYKGAIDFFPQSAIPSNAGAGSTYYDGDGGLRVFDGTTYFQIPNVVSGFSKPQEIQYGSSQVGFAANFIPAFSSAPTCVCSIGAIDGGEIVTCPISSITASSIVPRSNIGTTTSLGVFICIGNK